MSNQPAQHIKRVLLATAIVLLVDDNGNQHAARALLDSGSECCFVSETLAQRVQVRREKIFLPIVGIGNASTAAKQKFIATIRSRVGDFTTSADLFVLPKVTVDLPSTSFNTTSWKIPNNVPLADPAFYDCSPIDLVLGAEVFFEIFKPSGRIYIGDNLPVLINSTLGWVLSGSIVNRQPITTVIANLATVNDLQKLTEIFWALEEDSSAKCFSVEEAACEEHYRQNVSRNSEGRYVVRLPFKEWKLDTLGNNYRTALHRFRLLENRLKQNDLLANQYKDFMENYLVSNHMQRISLYGLPCSYYLPHHPVVREDSTTTKVRVVFDGSCKTAAGASLNDTLMVGPTVQQDLRAIIIRSRWRPVMITSDVKQMYRQILVDYRDTPYQRILWRSSPESDLEAFELKTVTYGTASAPFLATRTLLQLAEDEQQQFPLAAAALINDFYVDDCISGANTESEASVLQHQLEHLLAKGGFELRKWASNSEAVLANIPDEKRALLPALDLSRDQSIKTLGLHWVPSADQLRYKINMPSSSEKSALTKRKALSLIAQLFDPLGLVGPVVTLAKLFMQVLWTLHNVDGTPWEWDRELPEDIKDQWYDYYSQLPLLEELRIERCVVLPDAICTQLHFFSDASERAYGTCAFVRTVNSIGQCKTLLLTAKSKVAPLKKQSIPRLELCGALLAAELYAKIKTAISTTVEAHFWVDSTTVLAWLKASPSSWATFVANRVSKIQIATPKCKWRHVSGNQNPADCLSRGISAEHLLLSDLWWHGPTWLQLQESTWPILQGEPSSEEEIFQEARKLPPTSTVACSEPTFTDVFSARYSCFTKLLHISAYCRRFLINLPFLKDKRKLKHMRRETIEPLSLEELKSAEMKLIHNLQEQSFSVEIQHLRHSKPLPVKSRLKWFHPFLCSNQILRIGGRLGQASQPYDSKHQILLPGSHPLTTLIVRKYHEENLHAAPQLLLNILRTKYWIIGARALVRNFVHSCVKCVRARPQLVQQFMAELPSSRVNISRPFSVTGVDYWGPVFLQPAHRRGSTIKAYVAVFVCFSTKAVHIELVADLSTNKFVQALRRFVSRRGLCIEIHSDNGRNFLGASNELRQLFNSKEHNHTVSHECSLIGIKWVFNPPKASHFGGLWEAAIGSAQKHFHRVLGDHKLAYDDMVTLLCQIEACLNSRPLVPQSDDPSDYEALTPGHFLIGSNLKAVPDKDFTDVPCNRLRKWQLVQKLFQLMWKRWQVEYLCTLQKRVKWCSPPISIQPNQLVVLKDENTPPIKWTMARILHTHPGTDGVIRVVTLQTPQGHFTRPVAKLCLLPIAPIHEADCATNSQQFPTVS